VDVGSLLPHLLQTQPGSSTTPLANRRPPTLDHTCQSHSANLHHPKALTGQYSTSLRLTMTTPLTTACRNLQLDPSDHSRMATFSAFCWQHILERKPPRWIAEARDGTVRLQHRVRAPGSEQSCSVFHDAVDRMTYDFVLAYAERLRPAA
jgi:hypothetical protein